MEEGKERRQLLRERASLADFGLRAVEGVDLDQLLTDASREAAQSLGVKYVKVLEYLPDEQCFLVRAGVGWHEGVVGRARLEADGGSPAGLALRTGEPVISTDLDQEERFRIPAILREHGVRSMVNVIIKYRDDVFGVLEADSRESRIFTQDDVKFLQGYANILSLAIRQSRLSQANAELAARQEMLLRELQHRMRNDNQQLLSLVQLQLSEARDPKARETLEKVACRIMALGRVHEQLKAGSKPDTVSLGHYLRAVAGNLFEFHKQHGGEIKLRAEIADIEVPTGPAQALGLILNEFLTNSFKHAFKEGGGEFVIELSRDHESATLRLSDNGPGIAGQPAQGLGLKLIEALTAQIGAVTRWEQRAGVTLTIVFPVGAQPG